MLECIPENPVEHTTEKINPAKTCLPHSHGSHITGFSGMCKAMVSYLAQADGTTKKSKMNVLPGFVNPTTCGSPPER